MNGRERFIETMRYGAPDRIPCFNEGIQSEVLKAWRKQGLTPGVSLSEEFLSDEREEIEVDLEPSPKIEKLPTSLRDLEAMRQALDPLDRGRLPQPWSKRVLAWRSRNHVLMLRIHRGFFLSMGVDSWTRLEEVMDLLTSKPDVVREAMKIQGQFTAKLAERVLQEVDVDAAVFSEPIGGNNGPLISPQMYENLILPSYEPVLDLLYQHGVETIIFRTYANARLLIPSILKWGFNCLWACEVNIKAMDYRDLRREFGRNLRLIGGIDLDVLLDDKEAIRREVENKVPPLVADGGYMPLADGRVRKDVPYENYAYYRRLLERITRG